MLYSLSNKKKSFPRKNRLGRKSTHSHKWKNAERMREKTEKVRENAREHREKRPSKMTEKQSENEVRSKGSFLPFLV